MFDNLGRFTAHRPLWVLAAWGLLAGLLAAAAPAWEERCQDEDIHFLPARCLSVQGYELLRAAFPREVYGSKLILALERHDGRLRADDLALIKQLADELAALRRDHPDWGLGTITAPHDPLIGSRFCSPDGRCALVAVSLESPFLAIKTTEVVKQVEARLAPLVAAHRAALGPAGDGLAFALTGPAGIGRDLNDAAYRSLDDTTLATVVLVVVILLLVYRSPLLALVPLATVGVSVWVSLRVLALLALIPEFQLVNITKIFVVVVLYGAGTDYCLFLISRYREELHAGRAPRRALRCALRHVGGALTASAATVVCGLGMMGFAEFAKLKYTGPAIALSLLVALAASLTLAPALLRVLGWWAFWPRAAGPAGAAGPPGEGGERFWGWVSRHIAARPARIWLVSVLVLLPFAVLGYRTDYVFDVCAELPREAQSRQGLAAIRRHFTAGEIGPLTILLEGERDWSAPEGRAAVARLSRELAALPNVAEVRSLTQPLGVPPAEPAERPAWLAVLPRLADTLAESAAREFYLARPAQGRVTRLDVVFHTEPFAAESVATMHAVRQHLDRWQAARPVGAARYVLYGITPSVHDLAEVHEADRLRVQALVLVGILLILVAVVRRPFVAAYLLVSVLFSYYVTIGVTELLSLGWLEGELGRVDWKVPYFVFTILVAVGEDYNIFLMARVLEESRRHGWRAGTQRALARTGATITCCGLIMAGTFATMMLCSLITLVQLGIALAFGVLLDTFIVRPILVPAFLLVIGRRRAIPAAAADPPGEPAAAYQRAA